MNDESVERIALAMLTLRVNSPVGAWLAPDDERLLHEMWREAEQVPEGDEGLLLSMMNLAWYALMNLEAMTDRTAEEWLQTIAMDLEDGPDSDGPVTNP